MALNISNNNYSGILIEGLSSLVTIGANDYSLFHTALTSGSKVRIPYVDASPTIQDLSAGICSFVDGGDRVLDFMNLDLCEVGTQQTACISELFDTDYAAASAGYLSQDVDPELANAWARRIVHRFSKQVQNLRWAGDTLSSDPALALCDGVIKQVIAAGPNTTGNTTGYQQITAPVTGPSDVVSAITTVVTALPFEVKSHPMFKVVVGSDVANYLMAAVMQQTNVNNLPQVQFDMETGLLMDNFFGYSIYMADGILADPTNTGLILAGIFGDSDEGALKWGVNRPEDEKNIELKLIEDGDKVRMRIAVASAVAVIPDASQIALNV